MDLLARLEGRSRPEGDCLLVWMGSRKQSGHGHLRVDGQLRQVHRVAWELRHGPIPDGLHVLHTCDNPPCWTDGHLWLGTEGDNQRDKVAKGRHFSQQITHCPQGHAYDEANTYRWRNLRICRACRLDRERRRTARRRQ